MNVSNDSQSKSLLVSSEHEAIEEKINEDKKTKSSRKILKKSLDSRKCRYKLGVYVRLSPSDEIRKEGSLVSHPQRIQSFVDYKNSQETNWGEIVEIYTDKDYSGKDTNRPAFRNMLQDVKLGRINAVIVTELSRISRDVKDFCNFWEFMKLHKATFISLKENFDTTTPIGEMMVIQAISFAQFERKTIVQRIKDGARARAERGLLNGGTSILGYDHHPTKKGHLVVNEKEAVIVKHIFDKFMELGSLAKVSEYLNSNGYRTKQVTTKEGKQRGGVVWTAEALHTLLTNLRVIAKVEVNTFNRDVSPDEVSEFERYKIVEASWPPIVDDSLFYQVQEKLSANRRFGKKHVHLYRLSGLIECGLCGKPLSGKAANGRGGKYFYYAHSRKFHVDGRHRERCRLERIAAINLEERIIARLIELQKDQRLLHQMAMDAKGNQESVTKELEQMAAIKEQEKRKLDRLIDNLVMTVAEQAQGGNASVLLTKIAELEEQRKQIVQQLKGLRDDVLNKNKIVNLEHVFRIFRAFQRDFSGRPVHEQRDLLKACIAKIVVKDDGVHVLYYGSIQEDHFPRSSEEGIEGKILLSGKSENEIDSAKSPAKSKTPDLVFSRSGVRSVSGLVDARRIELLTFGMQIRRSTN